MSGAAQTLDHVGIVGADLDALATAFARLGFCLTPLARHAGGRTGNRCIMFRDGGYLELVATVNGGTSATLDRFLGRYPGIHILTLGIDDETAAAERLRGAGIDAHAERTERSTDDTDPLAPHAAFALLTPTDPPEGRVHLIRHLTPEAMWQQRFLTHPNQATRLEEAILVASVPAETAARLSILAGRPVQPDPAGGYVLPLASGRLRILPAGSWATLHPGQAVPTLPWIGGLTLTTTDGNAALCRLLHDRGVAYDQAPGLVQIEAAGVVLRFRADQG
jgi:hypothetical protein